MSKTFLPAILSALVFVFATLFTTAQTWSENVAQLIFDNCSKCHHEGGIAPMPLMSYDDVAGESEEVYEHVGDRHMPPWPANPEYRHFKNEAALSDEDLNTILDWIDNGMPFGNPDLEPDAPVFENPGTQLETIDFVAQIEPYTLQSNTDEIRWFSIPTNFTETVYVNKIEVIAGLPHLVHHADISYDDTGYTQFVDSMDPLSGFNGSTGSPNYSYYMNAWMAGGNVVDYPAGWGIAVPPGADFVFEIHYGPGGLGETDTTKMNLQFVTDPDNVRPIFAGWWLNQPTGESLSIPANTVSDFSQEAYVANDYSFISVCPHMHLLGDYYRVWFETAEGDTVPLCEIPEWHFHWQMYYTFQQVQKIPAGSTLKGYAIYDNTTENENNPNDPPELVTYCNATECEMMMTFFNYSAYEPGDENIVLDSTILVSTANRPLPPKLTVFPNPTDGPLTIEAYMQAPGPVTVRVLNAMGVTVLTHSWEIGYSSFMKTLQLGALPSGIYFVELVTAQGRRVERVVHCGR